MPTTELNQYNDVLAGHAAGQYGLPADVLAAQDRMRNLKSATGPAPSTEAAARRRLVEAFLEQADRRKPVWPDARDVAVAQQQTREHVVWNAVHAEARQLATSALVSSILATADEIVTDYLRPALEETLAMASPAAAATEGTTDDASLLLRMRDEYREAWATLDKASLRLRALRRAQECLQRGQVDDDRGEFLEMRNLRELWPSWGQSGPQPAPWDGLTDRARLRWLLNNGAELWMPTTDERNDLYRSRAAEGREARRFRPIGL